MIKRLPVRLFVLFFLVSAAGMQAAAQSVQDPTHWEYKITKTGNGLYELAFQVRLNEGWHIFSLDPGDEYLIPPSFHFSENSAAEMDGGILEQGKKIKARFEGVDSPVYYYEGEAAFIQKIRLKQQAVVYGTHEYQVCNDKICLPPVSRDFRFEIKD